MSGTKSSKGREKGLMTHFPKKKKKKSLDKHGSLYNFIFKSQIYRLHLIESIIPLIMEKITIFPTRNSCVFPILLKIELILKGKK